ncbi:MAG: protein-export chaperone SecB [Gammaproteobacteria bacterium]|jgi:preprotein translocase subunit SecB
MKNFLSGKKDNKKDTNFSKDKDKDKKDVKSASTNNASKNTDIKMNNNAGTNVSGNQQEQANLTIHSIFVKDISYEAPATPQAFSLPWEPQVKFDIQVMRRAVDQNAGVHEVILHTTISTKLKVKQAVGTTNKADQEVVAFLIDIKLGGVFTVKGLQESQLDRVLSTTAPTILFPYVAEAVASLVTKGGFPQFILPPIDFATLYQQRLAQGNNAPQANQDSATVS